MSVILVVCVVMNGFASCLAFKHGYTEREALNTYQLVTGSKSNFGDKRLKYNKAFHRQSQLSCFLVDRPQPDFIFEYKTASKCRGIRLYYVATDSVFVFEEPRKGRLQSVFKEARKIEEFEANIYEGLKSKTTP